MLTYSGIDSDAPCDLEALVAEAQITYKDYLGWQNPENSLRELDRIKELAQFIKDNYELVIVCGAGGSYTGARAIIEATDGQSANLTRKTKVVFMGNHLSSLGLQEVLSFVDTFNTCMIVVSKSGTTIETNIGYQLVLRRFKEKYENPYERIVIITGDDTGFLYREHAAHGMELLTVPKDVGGRYSLHTAVGLLPMAVADVDIDAFLAGLFDYRRLTENADNPSRRYACDRRALFLKGKTTEFLVSYDPRMEYYQKWYVQLFGESEGKHKDVIFPSYMVNTTDLHSMGQYLQEGPGNVFETVIDVSRYPVDFDVNLAAFDDCYQAHDHFSLNALKRIVSRATKEAHQKNDVTSLGIELERLDAYTMGEMAYFFMEACFVSSLLFHAHPFNQPGVEEYKQEYKHRLQ
ncbi:hypothetical protein O6R05_01570 [Peptoniphilus equinus]|uniref:Glucose-6-phosphate isomerase n=1 Tax=Peptoniphilus equinus TaxID=3016343 RepID=A0ABY7QU08_9FIRM|nr:hypothetical protein [Peptoniphilus equinus]WBW50259.1 hypothetical protein O6R05_01570 [Peptoniphilus equinus]